MTAYHREAEAEAGWTCHLGHPTTPPVEYRGAEYRFCPTCEDIAQDGAQLGEYHEGGIIVSTAADPEPTCDVCGRHMEDSPAGFADADWNGETGNHETCERSEVVLLPSPIIMRALARR